MMRLASVLLVAVLLSTCAIFSTFAKYVTVAEGSDAARVARWGFTTTSLNFENLFAESYTNVSNGITDQAIIAPGTNGKVSFAFVLADPAKLPEVAYSFSVSTAGSSNGTESNSNIKWRMTTSEIAPTDWKDEDTWSKLLSDIAGLSGTGNQDAGTIPAMVGTTYYVHWNWAFAGNDSEDNLLGNAAELATVTLKVTITATQKD